MRPDVQAWLKQAERDLVSAENCFNSADYYFSAFAAQQAVEKGLKAIYLKTHSDVWKIHDLVRLAKEVNAPQDIIEKCAVITPVYAEVRYPESDEMPSEKVNEAEAKNILKLAKEVMTWIKKEH